MHRPIRSIRHHLFSAFLLAFAFVVSARHASAQSVPGTLLVLEKSDNTLAIVDPVNFKIIAHVSAGPDPHEIVASPDGKLAYISNYGGLDSTLNTISVVNVPVRKALPPIELGVLHSAHGLDIQGANLYFTVETNKAIGRLNLTTQAVDWVLGTGQDRTHMVIANAAGDRLFTSNVTSGTISIIEQVTLAPPPPPPGAPQGAAPPPPRKTWQITNVPSGRGCEGFDVSPDGKQIWAANAGDGTVTVIDLATKKATQTFSISVDHANRLKFTPDGKRVLVSGLGAGPASGSAANVVVIDAATHKEIKQFNLGGGSAGILIVPDGSRAYVAVSAKDKVVSIDLRSLTVTAELPTGHNPDGLAWAASQ